MKLQHLNGAEAQQYARTHLCERARNATWEALYECPATHRWWLEWYPYPEAHGGGPPELTQISRGFAIARFPEAFPPLWTR